MEPRQAIMILETMKKLEGLHFWILKIPELTKQLLKEDCEVKWTREVHLGSVVFM